MPLTVWLCSDIATAKTRDDDDNSAGVAARAGQVCARHRQATGKELARHLITTCTGVGEVVAEAYPSSEATLVAAAELGRRAVACVAHFPLAQHIGQRLRATLPENKLRELAMRACRPDQMSRGLADHAGDVALVVAAPPPYETGGRASSTRDCPACRADFWMLNDQQLGGVLLASWRVLRPGGHLAIITSARHDGGALVDPAPRIIRQCGTLGFRYVQHIIALRVPIQGDELVVQAGPADLAQLRDIRTGPLPPAVSVHADVSLFTKPALPARSSGAR